MTKSKLILSSSDGHTSPVTDEALEIIFKSLPEESLQEKGVKMMISLCLNGVEHPETQRLGLFIRDNI